MLEAACKNLGNQLRGTQWSRPKSEISFLTAEPTQKREWSDLRAFVEEELMFKI